MDTGYSSRFSTQSVSGSKTSAPNIEQASMRAPPGIFRGWCVPLLLVAATWTNGAAAEFTGLWRLQGQDAYLGNYRGHLEIRNTPHSGAVAPSIHCSRLGDHSGVFTDVDLYRFQAAAHERIHVRINADSRGEVQGVHAAVVVLRQAAGGTKVLKVDAGALPMEISAEVPGHGDYLLAFVESPELPGVMPFRGNYCLSLDASAGAYGTLAATAWVEAPPQ